MKKLHLIILGGLFFVLQIASAQTCSSSEYWIRKCISEDSCGYIDKSGVWRIKPGRYNLLYTDSFCKVAIVYSKRANDLVGINKKEKILYHVHVFDNRPDEMSEGLYRIRIRKKYGFADNDGIAICPNFGFVFPFSEGLAAFVMGCHFVKSDEHNAVVGGTWGYMDRNGKIVMPPKYEWAGSFANEKAMAKINGREILIDRNFNEIGVW